MRWDTILIELLSSFSENLFDWWCGVVLNVSGTFICFQKFMFKIFYASSLFCGLIWSGNMPRILIPGFVNDYWFWNLFFLIKRWHIRDLIFLLIQDFNKWLCFFLIFLSIPHIALFIIKIYDRFHIDQFLFLTHNTDLRLFLQKLSWA